MAPPTVSFMWKTHKNYDTVPPTRPVCDASNGPIARSADLLSRILTPVMKAREYGEGCDSTEDMLATIHKTNEGLRENPAENISIMSMDAEALYPSLDMEDMLQSVWNLVMNTDISFCNIDIRYMAKYLYIMYSREVLVKCKIVSCIPKRQTEIDGTAKTKPTIAYLDSDYYYKTVNGERVKTYKWNWDRVRNPSELQKRKMIALTLIMSKKTVLSNYLYCFHKQLCRQSKGGPIGENITNVPAEMVTYEISGLLR